MTNYREILRLKKLGLNNSRIAQSLGCSRTTVIQALNVAEEKGISYPLPEDLSDRKLSELLFPSNRSKPEYKMPDYVALMICAFPIREMIDAYRDDFSTYAFLGVVIFIGMLVLAIVF